MPRKKRIWYPGAKYHITSRGIRRTSLLHDEEDRLEYFQLGRDNHSQTVYSPYVSPHD
ncbi:hypothetical protein [Aquibacillus rhizosphaerae]|uniref:Uncharacterized protein n=1 Tax=Aquibacillus rhizosphaerae TaxID=3051431 RepID=A0ABT7KZR2_9BACI|nr:hypothetical protein [Aquibacillus sp. LR5S19]MDL4838981.1 hypothetical protein [Aquibacillus sp. LR5S19]